MVFMEDSERAAAIAQDRRIDVGLHLNFTTPFSAPGTPTQLAEHQRQLAQYLRRHRWAQAVFHPGLAGTFKYVVAAQLDEFFRLYGAQAGRIDGHHHMHLSANVLIGKLLPEGTVVRRNFSFRPGEKTYFNRLYRGIIDRMLAKRHGLTDYLFSLPPFEPWGRLEKILVLGRQFLVEVETHPINEEEYLFPYGQRSISLDEKYSDCIAFCIPAHRYGTRRRRSMKEKATAPGNSPPKSTISTMGDFLPSLRSL
jgi:hypothetical protein